MRIHIYGVNQYPKALQGAALAQVGEELSVAFACMYVCTCVHV